MQGQHVGGVWREIGEVGRIQGGGVWVLELVEAIVCHLRPCFVVATHAHEFHKLNGRA